MVSGTEAKICFARSAAEKLVPDSAVAFSFVSVTKNVQFRIPAGLKTTTKLAVVICGFPSGIPVCGTANTQLATKIITNRNFCSKYANVMFLLFGF